MENKFYFKNKDQGDKVCYEVIGKDIFTGMRFSIGLSGTQKDAEKILEKYIIQRLPPYIALKKELPDVSHLFHIEKTTIAEYREHINAELKQRRILHNQRENLICFINSCWREIYPKIVKCAQEIGQHGITFGDHDLDEKLFNCTKCTVTKRKLSDSPQTFELVLEIVFRQAEEGPIGSTFNQSIVLFRGNDAEVLNYIHNEAFESICRMFFYTSISNHIYGLPCSDALYVSPIYEDKNRSRDELLYEYFKGFVSKPGMPCN